MRTIKPSCEQASQENDAPERPDQERMERLAALLRQEQPQQYQAPTFTPPGLNRPRR